MTTVIIKVGNGAVEEIIADKKVEIIVLDHDVEDKAWAGKKVEGNYCNQLYVADLIDVDADRVDYIKDDLDSDFDNEEEDDEDDEDDEEEEW